MPRSTSITANQGKFEFNILRPGRDPRDTGARSHPVYYAHEPNEDEDDEEKRIPAFPFHEECFKILTRCLGYQRRSDMNKDALYAVMKQNVEEIASALDLDYGALDGADQFWECHAGEEFVVMDPATDLGIERVVRCMLPSSLFDRPNIPFLDLMSKVHNDPFMLLPNEILNGVFAYLSIEDSVSLIRASAYARNSTNDPSFWRQMIRRHIVPFFWEIKDLLQSGSFPDTFDWRGALFWLDNATTATFAMDIRLAAIANRRRIWNTCEQLAPLYHEKVEKRRYIEPGDEEANEVLGTAKCYHSAALTFPPPATVQVVTAQFIRSWSDIAYHACDLEVYWSEYRNDLVGISIRFGTERRLFGRTSEHKTQSMHIPAGAWISDITISLTQIALCLSGPKHEIVRSCDDPRALGKADITGMTVQLTNGTEKSFKSFGNGENRRAFSVLPGMCIVGLTGEISPVRSFSFNNP